MTVVVIYAALVHGASVSVYAATRPLADEAEARQALERAFQMLRGGEYGGLYDVLPSASQRRISRERFVEALNRARGTFELDRMEVEAVRVAGDLAVVDTVVYGRALRPFQGEGKLVARQYMVREGGRWRVTTGDTSTVRPLLSANPSFARKFPPREPRVYLKRDGKWIDVNSTLKTIRRRRSTQ
jgi:hypothetical protein